MGAASQRRHEHLAPTQVPDAAEPPERLARDPQHQLWRTPLQHDRRKRLAACAQGNAGAVGAGEHLRRVIAQGRRVVLVDRTLDGLDVPTVLVDNALGTRTAVEHLIARGHRRIGFLGRAPSIYTSRGRYAGYVEALTEAGIAVDPSLVQREGFTGSSPRDAIERLLDLADPPTALFAGQDVITMTAVSVLQRRGLSERVALVGFDDFELADLLQPGVTVVAQDPRRIGALAAELALDPDGSGVHLVPTRLVERGSGEIPAPPAR